MATKVRTKKGKTLTLLNPFEKSIKYATELRDGQKYTNDGKIKRDKKGKAIKLGRKERAYRSGYLDARKDSAQAYKAKRAGRKNKKGR